MRPAPRPGLRPATVDEIKAAGMEPGYGSPIGAHDTVVVVDELVARSPNLVAGANREGFHFRNVNVGRDFAADVIADITNVQEGDPCPVCGSPVRLENGIEVGNIFKLGTKFTDAAGATYLGEDGREHPIVMGSYGIGVGRNVACIVEAHHDDKGIIWPEEVAPYAAHLVAIGANRDAQVAEVAERLHQLSLDVGPRDSLRRSGRVAGRQVHRCGAARDALDPDRFTPLHRRRRRRGDGTRDRRAGHPIDRRGRGAHPGRGSRPRLTGTRDSTIDGVMPPRPMLPRDDLYARLELPVNCSPEAIEIAWRALLKRHHPDVAGADADDVAKRINVAHDWLSDPALRERYDRERHAGGRRDGGPTDLRGRAGRAVRSAPTRPSRPVAPKPRRPADPEEALARHLSRIGRLSRDELDRLALAESPPIAFVATIARFLSPDRLAAVEAVERRVAAVLPPSSRWDAPTRDAIVAYAHELILGPFLDEHLSEPFRERVRERLARGWEAAVDQPRYGPNTAAVSAALERLRAMPPGRRAQLVVEAAGLRATSPAGLRADLPVAGRPIRP